MTKGNRVLSLSLDNGVLASAVDTVKELSDILVAHKGSTVEKSSRLGNEVNVVTLNKDLVLLCLVLLDGNTLEHLDVTNTLLAQEVADFSRLLVTGNDDVDGEMGVDGTHLVLETDGNTLDHVGNACRGSSEASGVLAVGVPNNELDLLASRALDDAGIKVHVLEGLSLWERSKKGKCQCSASVRVSRVSRLRLVLKVAAEALLQHDPV